MKDAGLFVQTFAHIIQQRGVLAVFSILLPEMPTMRWQTEDEEDSRLDAARQRT